MKRKHIEENTKQCAPGMTYLRAPKAAENI